LEAVTRCLRAARDFVTDSTIPTAFTSTGALQFGGGIDVRTPIKIFLPIGLRGEVRDFYSFDTLEFATPVRGNRQHNVIVSGGFILRF
jgi:hypothetical protein